MFGIVKGIARAAVGVATLPVTVAADVVTLNGVLTERRSSYTGERVRDVLDALEDAVRDRD